MMLVGGADARVDARNLKRMAARAMAGLARTGSSMSNGSGDYAIAFTTSRSANLIGNDAVSPLFEAVIEASEEAIYNSLFKATTTTGNGHTVAALPLPETLRILKKYGAIK